METIQLLVSLCPEALSIQNNWDSTPLHQALADPLLGIQKENRLELVEFLISKHPDALSMKNMAGNTPLHEACWRKAPVEIIRMLVAKCPAATMECNGDYGDLPLHQLWRRRNADRVRPTGEYLLTVTHKLLEAHPDSLKVTNNEGHRPFEMFLVYHGWMTQVPCKNSLSPSRPKEMDFGSLQSLIPRIPANRFTDKEGKDHYLLMYHLVWLVAGQPPTGHNGEDSLIDEQRDEQLHRHDDLSRAEAMDSLQEAPGTPSLPLNGEGLGLGSADGEGGGSETPKVVAHDNGPTGTAHQNLDEPLVGGIYQLALLDEDEGYSRSQAPNNEVDEEEAADENDESSYYDGSYCSDDAADEGSYYDRDGSYYSDEGSYYSDEGGSYYSDERSYYSDEGGSYYSGDNGSYYSGEGSYIDDDEPSTRSERMEALVELTKMALEKEDASTLLEPNDEGSTLLHIACRGGASSSIIRYLLERCPDLIEKRDNHGSMALHRACESEGVSSDVAKLLFAANPGAIELENGTGHLPFQLASENPSSSLETIFFLVGKSIFAFANLCK
jgi:Ankyrin repeats (3 copies)/Ankyrin repeats (many copies)